MTVPSPALRVCMRVGVVCFVQKWMCTNPYLHTKCGPIFLDPPLPCPHLSISTVGVQKLTTGTLSRWHPVLPVNACKVLQSIIVLRDLCTCGQGEQACAVLPVRYSARALHTSSTLLALLIFTGNHVQGFLYGFFALTLSGVADSATCALLRL